MSGALQSAARPAAALQAAVGALAPAPPLVQRRSGVGFVPPVTSLAAVPARPAVQRTCEACGEEEREEGIVQPRRRVGSAGAPPEAPIDRVGSGAAAAVQRTCEAFGEQEEGNKVQPRLEVGAAADPLEAEADAIAARVMAMETGAASEAPATVQRTCTACSSTRDEPKARRAGNGESASEDEEEEVKVKARRAPEGRGGETIQASDAELTAGGAALPEATRSFFEPRMGRDLSGVRIHQGSAALSLNRSISARAFTYRNHIWLGSGESASPSFTLAHELAHVMQQTAPGPIGDDRGEVIRPSASMAGDARVRRTYHYSEQGKNLPHAHDEVVQWLTEQDKSLFAEVPVPNANRRKSLLGSEKSFGRADLVSFEGSDHEVPVGMAVVPCNEQEKDNWYCAYGAQKGLGKPAPLNVSTFANAKILHGGKTWEHQGDQSRPRFGPIIGATFGQGFLRDAGGREAAARPYAMVQSAGTPNAVTTQIRIGDVKAAAHKSAVLGASAQVTEYRLGFNDVRNFYENVRNQVETRRKGPPKKGFNDAASLPPPLTPWNMTTGILESIKGVEGVAKVTSEPRNLELKKWSFGVERLIKVPPTKGHLYVWRGKGESEAAWPYIWAPDDKKAGKLAASLTKDGKFEALGSDADCLREALLVPATPRKPGSVPTASRAPACLKRLPANKAPADVVRRRTKGKKPKPVPSDPFAVIYPDWKRKQERLTKDFTAYQGSEKGEERLAAMAELEARAHIQDAMPDRKDTPSKKDEEALKAQASAFVWMETFGGKSGTMIGTLRYRLGWLFETLVSAFATVKKDAQAFFEKLSPKKPGKGIIKATLNIVAKLLGAMANWILPRVSQALTDCVEAGVNSKIDALFSDGPVGSIRAAIEEAQAFAAEFVGDVVANMSNLGANLLGDLKATIEKIKEAADFIANMVVLGKDVFHAVRLAICAAGAAETFGVSCGIVGLDVLLSQLGASPFEALAGALLATCMGQTMLVQGMRKFPSVRDLPRTIASSIIGTIRPKLPTGAQGFLCDAETMALKEPDIADVTCGAGGSPSATPGPDAKGEYKPGAEKIPPGQETPPARDEKEARQENLPPGTADPNSGPGSGGGGPSTLGEGPGRTLLPDSTLNQDSLKPRTPAADSLNLSTPTQQGGAADLLGGGKPTLGAAPVEGEKNRSDTLSSPQGQDGLDTSLIPPTVPDKLVDKRDTLPSTGTSPLTGLPRQEGAKDEWGVPDLLGGPDSPGPEPTGWKDTLGLPPGPGEENRTKKDSLDSPPSGGGYDQPDASQPGGGKDQKDQEQPGGKDKVGQDPPGGEGKADNEELGLERDKLPLPQQKESKSKTGKHQDPVPLPEVGYWDPEQGGFAAYVPADSVETFKLEMGIDKTLKVHKVKTTIALFGIENSVLEKQVKLPRKQDVTMGVTIEGKYIYLPEKVSIVVTSVVVYKTKCHVEFKMVNDVSLKFGKQYLQLPSSEANWGSARRSVKKK